MWQADIATELNNASPRERKAIISSYAERTGKGNAQLYRIAKRHGFDSGRKSRADKGVLKCSLNKKQIDFVAALIATSARDKKGPILIVEDALEIAFDNGIIERGQVTAATMSRILRERQINAEALKRERPHTEMRSLHPNHVHQVDASVCIQYYLKSGKTAIMRESEYIKGNLHGKVKTKTRLLRYLLVDHFSGFIFPLYFDTTGETKENLYKLLTAAWAHKGDDKMPFRGVPFQILMDRGSANISKAITQFLEDRLDIEVPAGMPYNKMRQGAVETAQNIVERRFESKLAFQPAFSIEDLNDWAYDWAVWFNATQNHTRHGMTRTACWMLITKEQLRELPSRELLQDLFAEPEKECTVDGDYKISFRGKEYRLKHIEGLFRGAKVKAVLKPFKWPSIDVAYRDAVYEAAPLERLSPMEGGFVEHAAVIGQEYKATPETLTQRAQKRFENMAYGEERKKGAAPFEGITVHGIHSGKVGNLMFMPKEGTPIEVDRAVTERRISFMEFLKRLRAEVGTVSKDLNARLRAEFGSSLTEIEAEEAIKRIKHGGHSDTERKSAAL
jgi:transposase InsO family protein